jgi:hypothetical protein
MSKREYIRRIFKLLDDLRKLNRRPQLIAAEQRAERAEKLATDTAHEWNQEIKARERVEAELADAERRERNLNAARERAEAERDKWFDVANGRGLIPAAEAKARADRAEAALRELVREADRMMETDGPFGFEEALSEARAIVGGKGD